MRYESPFSGNYLTPDLLGLKAKVICKVVYWLTVRLFAPSSPFSAEAVARWFRRCLSAGLGGGGTRVPLPVCLPKPGTGLPGRQAHFFGIFLTAF